MQAVTGKVRSNSFSIQRISFANQHFRINFIFLIFCDEFFYRLQTFLLSVSMFLRWVSIFFYELFCNLIPWIILSNRQNFIIETCITPENFLDRRFDLGAIQIVCILLRGWVGSILSILHTKLSTEPRSCGV